MASSSKLSSAQVKILAAKELVENTIDQHTVAIFSKNYCPYCSRAKALFKAEFPNANTKIYELDERHDGGLIQSYLQEKTGQRTVPNIFVNKKHVGGCDAVVALNSQGKLAPLVGTQ